MEQSIDAVGKNLQDLRESRKLSLDKLSEMTGVSKSMLRQIETGKSSPTIATIWKIANGLKVSFTTLLRKPSIEARVRAFKHNRPLTDEARHYRVFPLVPFEPDLSFESYYVEIDAGTLFKGEPHEGNVCEYIFVTQGQVTITVDDKDYPVSENEFMQFQADCPHAYQSTGEDMAKMIMQICYLP